MLRKARIEDIRVIHQKLNQLAAEGKLLPRSLSDLYTHIRDMHVFLDRDGQLIGCSALHVVWDDLAEVRSLAVLESHRRKGIGRQLVDACLAEARELGIHRVFVLTYEPEFFGRLGFKIVDKQVFPQKIWADCLHCTKFPDCDEIAMVLELDA